MTLSLRIALMRDSVSSLFISSTRSVMGSMSVAAKALAETAEEKMQHRSGLSEKGGVQEADAHQAGPKPRNWAGRPNTDNAPAIL